MSSSCLPKEASMHNSLLSRPRRGCCWQRPQCYWCLFSIFPRFWQKRSLRILVFPIGFFLNWRLLSPLLVEAIAASRLLLLQEKRLLLSLYWSLHSLLSKEASPERHWKRERIKGTGNVETRLSFYFYGSSTLYCVLNSKGCCFFYSWQKWKEKQQQQKRREKKKKQAAFSFICRSGVVRPVVGVS